jgi:hypothetical protein
METGSGSMKRLFRWERLANDRSALNSAYTIDLL